MLLAFDVGNTNIVLGVFKDGQMIANWRMETDNKKSADEYGMIISQLFKYEGLKMENVKDVIISTVVPSVLYTLQHLSMKYFNRKAMVIGPGIKTGLIVKYDNPKQVGADRIVNAVAAYAKYGGPLVVIDFGTATTFDIVDKDNNGDKFFIIMCEVVIKNDNSFVCLNCGKDVEKLKFFHISDLPDNIFKPNLPALEKYISKRVGD